MLNSNFIKIGLGAFLFGSLIFAGVEEELKKINQKLDGISKRLGALEKKVAAGPAAPKNNKKQADPNAVYNVPVGDSVVLGNPNAKITIIKWTDFQWPYCAKSVSLIDDILAKYPNDVKVVVKNFPLSFHKQAKKAAKYAFAAHKQGKYKEMYHKIMENFRDLKNNEDLPMTYAREFGLNMSQFVRDFESPEVAAQIEKEINELKTSGIPRLAVPKFLIQGKEPQGRSVEAFSAAIDKILKEG